MKIYYKYTGNAAESSALPKIALYCRKQQNQQQQQVFYLSTTGGVTG